jgi:membrane associated rhomboid family serine protease
LSTASDATAENDAPRVTSAVQVLIAINVAILFLQFTVVKTEDIVGSLGFSLERLGYWWSVVTYMFVHGGPLHLAMNMYALFVFGPRLEHAWGTKRFTWFYLFCGVAGLLCHAAFVRNDTPLVGASAAIFGVMTAYAMQWPDDEVFLFGVLPLRVWTMVWLFVGLNLAMGLATTAGGLASMAYFAHLGGAIAGWVYMRTPGTTSLDSLKHRVARVPDVEDPPRAIPRSPPRARDRLDEVDEIVARSKAIAAKRPVAMSPARPRDLKAEELNRVLDKISAHGLQSLTSDEKRVLEEMARILRGD